MLDSMIEPDCVSKEEYFLEQQIQDFFCEAIESIERCFQFKPTKDFLYKLEKALRNQLEWALEFVYEAELSEKEIAALKNDIKEMRYLFEYS
jgi:hypothetical protein